MVKVLKDIILKVGAAGYGAVAVVNDMGPTNLRVMKHFGIDPAGNKISFKNPVAEREVFVFADAPHLIKLVRNNFLDSGFFLSNENHVSPDSIYEMLKHTKTEYGLAYKLNETHLNVTGYQRQRVNYAVQLLSKSCANALKFLGEKGLLKSRN